MNAETNHVFDEAVKRLIPNQEDQRPEALRKRRSRFRGLESHRLHHPRRSTPAGDTN